jgi:hypothetical protein
MIVERKSISELLITDIAVAIRPVTTKIGGTYSGILARDWGRSGTDR